MKMGFLLAATVESYDWQMVDIGQSAAVRRVGLR